ncbi:hypothetical protein Hanom_Chr15g01371051 [Helianthus anomalus]
MGFGVLKVTVTRRHVAPSPERKRQSPSNFIVSSSIYHHSSTDLRRDFYSRYRYRYSKHYPSPFADVTLNFRRLSWFRFDEYGWRRAVNEDMEMKIEETLANVCLNLCSNVLLKRPLMATAYFFFFVVVGK